MPDQKANTPSETTVEETSGRAAKSVDVPTPPAKAGDVVTAKANGIGPGPESTKAPTVNEPAAKSWSKMLVPLIVLALAAVILIAIVGGWNRWVGGGKWEKTDDAILRADITPLSTRVSGTVAQVAVADYQRVKAGDLLVQLKDDDFKAQVFDHFEIVFRSLALRREVVADEHRIGSV